MLRGPYDQEPEDIVSPNCRVCDCNPCMCGHHQYESDRQYQERQNRDAEYFSRIGPLRDPEEHN